MSTSDPGFVEGVFDAGRFDFEEGGTVPSMRIGYCTWGRLDEARDNAVLLLAETSGSRHSYDAYVGSGLAYDTDRFFVVAVDPIGGGASSQPGDGLGAAFPSYGIRDMVRAQHALVTRGLGLAGLLAVSGASAGSFQALEWGIAHAEFMRGLVLLVPAARSDNHFGAICDALEATITLDPAYEGRPAEAREGLRRASLVFFPWLTSDAFLAGLDPAGLAAAQTQAGDAWAKWHPDSLISRYRASRRHDVSRPFGGDMAAALSRVKAQVLGLRSTTDRTVPAYLTRELADGLPNAVFRDIDTDRGHSACTAPAGTPEYDVISREIRTFLERLRSK